MSTFTFEGFAQSSLVTLSAAAQGEQGAAGSVPEWRLSNMNTGTLDIARLDPNELVAPAGIWFDATSPIGLGSSEVTSPTTSDDPSAHEITYIWDFNDPGTFEAPLNVPTVWNDKSIAYGKRVYHVFDAPGTYIVRVRAIGRQGVTGERMISVTIIGPDDAYPGTRTICLSLANNFTGAPTGSDNYTSVSLAQAAYEALAQPGRLLLRAGEDFGAFSFSVGSDMPNARIGSFGTGTKPIIRPNYGVTGSPTCISAGGTAKDVVVYGLRCVGEWDATTETGDGRGSFVSSGGFYGVSGWNFLVYQCETNGVTNNLGVSNDGSNPNAGGNVQWVDCHVTNWKQYGIGVFENLRVVDGRVALVGCAVHASENACIGNQGQNGFGNEQGAVRISSHDIVTISASSFYSASTWPSVNVPNNAVRLFTSGFGGTRGNFERAVAEGGIDCFDLDGQDGGITEVPGNHVFDKCIAVGDYGTEFGFKVAYGGTTVRNAYYYQPDINTRPSNAMVGFVRNFVDNLNETNQNARMDFYNCTLVHHETSSKVLVHDTSFNNLATANNVIHGPDASQTPNAPIDIASAISGITPKNRGRRASPTKISQSLSLANGATSGTISYPGLTTQADYSAGGNHGIIYGTYLGGSHYYRSRGDFTISFGVTGFTVTNTSGAAWSGTATFQLDNESLSNQSGTGSPATIPLPTPQAGSNALTAEAGNQAYMTLLTEERTTIKRGAV